MYFRNKTIEEVKNELREHLNNYREALKAWEAVKINTKKSGEEFAQLSRAVDGAQFGAYYPVEDGAHPYLTVSYHIGAKYCRDQIEAYFYMDKLPKGTERETVFHGGITRDTTPMTAQELRARIAGYIEDLKRRIKEYENMMTVAEEAFTQYRNAVIEAEKRLRAACKACDEGEKIGDNSLYYAITATR